MPLNTKKAGDCRGSESDGSRSEKWCSLCYTDGKFINPETSLDEMIKIVDNALKEQNSGFFMRKMAVKQLPTLERWRSK
jgi:hypothetical protein